MLDHRRRTGGTSLIEAMVALAILGVVVLFGTSFFLKRREVERERADRDVALRALRSEWAYVRTLPLTPRESGPFVGSPMYLGMVAERDPRLSARPTGTPGLLRVTLEIGYGVKRPRRVSQEGFVFVPGAAP